MKSGLTQKQILQKETRMVYLYNKSNTRKIKLCKKPNIVGTIVSMKKAINMN